MNVPEALVITNPKEAQTHLRNDVITVDQAAGQKGRGHESQARQVTCRLDKDRR
jgi:hypothetical protein